LALATFAGRFLPVGCGIVIDIGSTTTDLIPLIDGRPCPRGCTDPDRLRFFELVYTGVRRTPLCAILGPGVAAELFATALDMNLVLGNITENPNDRDTADGRPATRPFAHARLARMLCEDPDSCPPERTEQLAQRALRHQVLHLTKALDQVAESLPTTPQAVLHSGEGEFLARLVLRGQESFRPAAVLSLAETLGPEISRAACAYAVAKLAEGWGG
jgi:probable H4MPT-linked C1 transfer pathway protein